MGGSVNQGPLWGPSFKGAVLCIRPEKVPKLRGKKVEAQGLRMFWGSGRPQLLK